MVHTRAKIAGTILFDQESHREKRQTETERGIEILDSEVHDTSEREDERYILGKQSISGDNIQETFITC
jgi:DNA-directed RNA polymerase subunit M/transcription elongation factor TFIIS